MVLCPVEIVTNIAILFPMLGILTNIPYYKYSIIMRTLQSQSRGHFLAGTNCLGRNAPGTYRGMTARQWRLETALRGLFPRKKTILDAAATAAKMKNLDTSFFGEAEEEEDAVLVVSTGAGKQAGADVHVGGDKTRGTEADFSNGDRYIGDLKEGKRHGHGKSWESKNVCTLACSHGAVPSHAGVYYYGSGDKYTGTWKLGKQEGHGVYEYANGDRYVGEWLDGKHHGAGSYHFVSGKVFQGSYKLGVPSGHGVFLYTNGEKLDGEWNGSAYPDHGIYSYANGDRYGGSWQQGKKHGIGTYYFANGSKYQGEYNEGEPSGMAHFVEADGRTYDEVWIAGKRTRRTLITTVKLTGRRELGACVM